MIGSLGNPYRRVAVVCGWALLSAGKGAFPKDNPKDPQDVLATVYQHLGIDTQKHYLDHSGRPIITLPFPPPALGTWAVDRAKPAPASP